ATANLSVALEQLNSSLYRYVNGNLSNMQTTYYSLNNQTYGYPCGPYPAGVAGSSNGSAAQGVVYPCGKYNATSMYVAQEQITATIPDIHNLSKVIGALSAVNGIHITNAAATLTGQQSSSLRKLAYASAMTNATSQAQALAGNATLSIQNITTSYYNFYPVPYALGASSAAGINSSIQVNPQFYSGSATVTESITVQFSYNR
ncbi:MAG: SIMPL domain-containing protein, partial [Candidatus Micrarchaeota archaeon]|nr:SIMPL domain-containing protein [Candidatus Micrarchaeota archaeon]